MAESGIIELLPYSTEWPGVYELEQRNLERIFCGEQVQIEHIGSTSVPGLSAKPIIDILLGAREISVIETKIPELKAASYSYIPEFEDELPDRRYFVKPLDPPHQYHLHAVKKGSKFWNDHIKFRNILRNDGKIMFKYESLKLSLAKKYHYDRKNYTNGKAGFIAEVLQAADKKINE